MISSELKNTLTLFEEEIAGLYENHERTFDLESFHGRFHILRCLLLADAIHQYYVLKGYNLDIQKSYYAILFHDCKREDNGIDLREKESAEECFTFLKGKGHDAEYALLSSKMILKNNLFTIEEQILYDVDVLDYNRFFFLPEERNLFEDFRLKFVGYSDVSGIIDEEARQKIILLAQQLVKYSQTLLVSIPTNSLVKIVLDYYLKMKPY